MKEKINVLVSLSEDERTIAIDYFEGNEITNLVKHKIIDIETSDLAKGQKEKTFELLGSVIMNIFESRSKNGIGFKKTPISGSEVLREAAENGDASAQNALAMFYLEKSLEQKNVSFIRDAEYWLKKAADQKFEPAVKFLGESWVSLKKDYIEQINNK